MDYSLLSRQWSRRISIFSPGYEAIHIGLPFLVGLIVLATAVCGQKISLDPLDAPYWLILIAGNGHAALSVMFLSTVPEGKRLLTELLKQRKTRLLFAFMMPIAVCIYFALEKLSLVGTSLPASATRFLTMFLFAQHGFGQMRGISLMYDRALVVQRHLTAADRVKLHKLGRVERWLHRMLLGVWSLQILSANFFENRLVTWTIVAVFAVIFCLLVVSMLSPHAKYSNKTLYLSRLVIFNFGFFVPQMTLLPLSVHGLEYQLLLTKMTKSSRTRFSPIFWVGAIAIAHFIYPLVIGVAKLEGTLISAQVAMIFIMVQKFIDYQHYYIDGLIFKFSNPVVAEGLGQLIDLNIQNDRQSAPGSQISMPA